ncbi:MAG: 16S rRNA (uracil(1498)-N(3))-methyltransferase [Bacteroidota bacterium]|nr:16S rRNA (uracil(1498)-N(3))-methyltransferase [Bacteroidota bacterium]
MHVFYTPDIKTTLEMPEDESLHCAKVLRLPEGEEVVLTDGKGSLFRARIVRAHPKRCAVEILEEIPASHHRDFSVHIAVAPTKNIDRTEWFAEKATEIGLDALTLLRCRYSERKEVKNDRIQKILVSAMKQSLKASLPVLDGLVSFSDFVKMPFDGQKFIAHCYDDPDKKSLTSQYNKGGNVLILIGPEGDFSEEEVALAKQNGFLPVSLSSSRLRTETAALVACHTIHILND